MGKRTRYRSCNDLEIPSQTNEVTPLLPDNELLQQLQQAAEINGSLPAGEGRATRGPLRSKKSYNMPRHKEIY